MFTVVVPLYNKENSIARAIDSVLAQKYDDFELIIVNDGSTDSSVDVVAKYNDPRLTLVHQNNAGVSVARNLGVKLASRELVAFLDADDAWHPFFLHAIQILVNQFPEAEWYSTSWKYAMKGENITSLLDPGENDVQPQCIDFFEHSVRRVVANTATTVIRKAVLDKLHGFPIGVKIFEDQDLHCRLAKRGCLAFMDLPYHYYFRDAENRACATRTVQDMPPFFVEHEAVMVRNHENQSQNYWIKELLIDRYLKEASLCFQTKGERSRGVHWLSLCRTTKLQRIRYAKGWLYALLPPIAVRAVVSTVSRIVG